MLLLQKPLLLLVLALVLLPQSPLLLFVLALVFLPKSPLLLLVLALLLLPELLLLELELALLLLSELSLLFLELLLFLGVPALLLLLEPLLLMLLLGGLALLLLLELLLLVLFFPKLRRPLSWFVPRWFSLVSEVTCLSQTAPPSLPSFSESIRLNVLYPCAMTCSEFSLNFLTFAFSRLFLSPNHAARPILLATPECNVGASPWLRL